MCDYSEQETERLGSIARLVRTSITMAAWIVAQHLLKGCPGPLPFGLGKKWSPGRRATELDLVGDDNGDGISRPASSLVRRIRTQQCARPGQQFALVGG